MPSVFHVADEPRGLVQKCIRCCAVLVDYHGAMVPGDSFEPMFFPAYRIVEVDGRATILHEPGQANGGHPNINLCHGNRDARLGAVES